MKGEIIKKNGKKGAHRRCKVNGVRDGGSWNSREAELQNKGNRKRNREKRNNERKREHVRERKGGESMWRGWQALMPGGLF